MGGGGGGGGVVRSPRRVGVEIFSQPKNAKKIIILEVMKYKQL